MTDDAKFDGSRVNLRRNTVRTQYLELWRCRIPAAVAEQRCASLTLDIIPLNLYTGHTKHFAHLLCLEGVQPRGGLVGKQEAG